MSILSIVFDPNLIPGLDFDNSDTILSGLYLAVEAEERLKEEVVHIECDVAMEKLIPEQLMDRLWAALEGELQGMDAEANDAVVLERFLSEFQYFKVGKGKTRNILQPVCFSSREHRYLISLINQGLSGVDSACVRVLAQSPRSVKMADFVLQGGFDYVVREMV